MPAQQPPDALSGDYAPDLADLLAISSAMVEAAEKQDWDRLDILGQRYFRQFDALASQLGTPAARSAVRMLADNEQRVRDHALPWMTAARKLLDQWSTVAERPDASAAAR